MTSPNTPCLFPEEGSVLEPTVHISRPGWKVEGSFKHSVPPPAWWSDSETPPRAETSEHSGTNQLVALFGDVKEAWPWCRDYVTGSRLLQSLASPHLWSFGLFPCEDVISQLPTPASMSPNHVGWRHSRPHVSQVSTRVYQMKIKTLG